MIKCSFLFPVLLSLALTVSACAPNTGAPIATATAVENDLQLKLDTYLMRLSDLGFSGSVLVAQKGEVLLSKGYGFADANRSKPITTETIFAIGSNTKPFTAAAILKLHDQGLLQVTDSIDQFLPNVPSDKAGITLHQLLTHSSGLDHSGVFNGDFESVSRPEAVQRILRSPLLFRPGEESSYSDYGYILLAAIVETVSGRAYQDFLRAELLQPAGMTHTGWWGNDTALKGLPTAGAISNLSGPYWALMGAGGMVSSVDDLYRWYLALRQGKILAADTLDVYSSVQFRMDERGGASYGWVVVNEYGQQVLAHAGGTPQLKQNNVMYWFMGDDIFIAASSVGQGIKAEDVAPNLNKIVFEQPYQLPPKVVAVEPAILDLYAGRYEISPGNALVVARDGNKLSVTGEGPEAFNLLFKTDLGIDVQAYEAAVVNYLKDHKDRQLEAWKSRVSQRLGKYLGFAVMGTASPTGSGEPWTYVSFEFEHGRALTRWIVSPAGALEAALLETEPPYMAFLPQSWNRFMPFSLSSQPAIQELVFSKDAAESVSVIISLPESQLSVPRQSSNG